MSFMKTVKTSVGYLRTLLARRFPLAAGSTDVASIFNFLTIDERVATSGQPTEAQFAAVKQAGYDVVINLAPDSGENSLKDERGVLTALGLQYVHIPVDFKNPTDDDFTRFCDAMQAAQDRRVLVHCAANMRVSAFMYRYRCQIQGENPQLAQQDLHRIWTPSGVWKQFVGRASR